MNILCLHGPNLNMLGQRQPEVYGTTTLLEIDDGLIELGQSLGVQVRCAQSNHEGELIDWIQQARGRVDGLLINPAGYTHTSVALRDAIIALDVPTIEVHISNVYKREPFRHKSLLADVCVGRLMGFGASGYKLALQGLVGLLQADPPRTPT